MKICPNCHRKNSSKFKFCRYCGTKLPSKSVDSNSIAQGHSINYKYCPNCHYKNNKDAKFCVKCGYRFGSQKISQNKDIPSVKNEPQTKSIPKEHQHKVAPQAQDINYKYCPNCHYKNGKDAKFCIKCGYKFGSESTSKAINTSGIKENTKINRVTAPHTNYKQQWNQANKSLNAVTDYSNNYFAWYKNTLIHPLADHKASPYFGMTSMAVMAILVWFANIIGENSVNVQGWLFDLISSDSPLRIYVQNYNSVQASKIGCLILSFASIIIYGLFSYIGASFISRSHHNFYHVINKFGSMVNLGIPISIVLILGAITDKSFITFVASVLIEFIIYIATAHVIIGIKHPKPSKLNRFYLSILTVFISYFVVSIAVSIIGIML